jgi:tRNA(Ser,Leu) C12 N-acetylase TAN1
MAIIINIDLDRIKKKVNKSIKKEMMDRLEKMKSFAIDISPTKTHTFIKKHKIIPPKLEE